jgi:hypothetical protein
MEGQMRTHALSVSLLGLVVVVAAAWRFSPGGRFAL